MEDNTRRGTHVPTWEELQTMLDTARTHPETACWGLYRYLNAHYKELGSKAARTMLATYMTIPHEQPSTLHSCFLSVAVKMAYEFPDFRFHDFLRYWGYSDKLRPADRRPVTIDGREIPSLRERTERARQHCLIRDSRNNPLAPAATTPAGGGERVLTMVAVKLWESKDGGENKRSVKLIGPEGQELTANVHAFNCQPQNIARRLFDVLIRNNGGRDSVCRATPAERKIEDVFPAVTGYIKNYDPEHSFYHIYDALSRHFVAEMPQGAAVAGAYVRFAPIIPERDKFKSAIIIKPLTQQEGRESFGTYTATVTYVNLERGFFSYKITSELRQTPEGTATQEGSASAYTPGTSDISLRVGERIRIVMFLTRRRDRTKQNYVAEVLPLTD